MLGTGDSNMNPCPPETNGLMSTMCNTAKIASDVKRETISISFGNGEQFQSRMNGTVNLEAHN